LKIDIYLCNTVAFFKNIVYICNIVALLKYFYIMRKFLFVFSMLFLGTMSLFSCKKDGGAFVITFISPTDGSTVTDASDAHIEIKFEAPDELEEYEISLSVDSVGAAAIAPFPLSGHDHVKTKTISEHVNLSAYPSGTAFRLKASLCKNHDCTEKLESSVRFLIP
jgi:hypothetical protein